MNKKTALALGAVFSGLGVALTGYHSKHIYELSAGFGDFKSFCNISTTFNCDVVASSSYSMPIPNVPLSSLGGVAFGFLFFMFMRALIRNRQSQLEVKTLRLFSVFALAVGLIYQGISAFVLKTFCLTCIAEDVLYLLIVILAFLSTKAFASGAKANAGAGGESSETKALGVGFALSLFIIPLAFMTLKPNTAVEPERIGEYVNSFMLEKPLSVSEDGLPSYGPKDAKFVIHKFSDFQCPFCKIAGGMLKRLRERHPDSVRVVYHHFPLDSSCNRGVESSAHANACMLAKSALCAHRQGKYEELYDEIFDHQDILKGASNEVSEKVRIWAQTSGINLVDFDKCLKNDEVAAPLSADIEEGLKLDIQSTPTLFLNGRKMEGVYPMEAWEALFGKL